MRGIEKFFCLDKQASDNYLADLNLLERIRFKFKTFLYKHFNIWDIWDIVPYRWERIFYDRIKPIYAPKHSRIRKSVPRTWVDICSLIEDVNFEMIKSFYEEEFIDGIVNWESDDRHTEFSKWLTSAYKYITEERPLLQKKMDESYPETGSADQLCDEKINPDGSKTYQLKSCEELYGKSYQELYGKVEEYETLITNKDTEVLLSMVKYRQFFWT